MINTSDLDNEFVKDMTGEIIAVRQVIQKTNLVEFGPIEKTLNWTNINVVEQNQALREILINQQQIMAQLARLDKQVKKTRKIHKMTTQQLSHLHEKPRLISVIVRTGVDFDKEMERTR